MQDAAPEKLFRRKVEQVESGEKVERCDGRLIARR
jgi:hypothetical protein